MAIVCVAYSMPHFDMVVGSNAVPSDKFLSFLAGLNCSLSIHNVTLGNTPDYLGETKSKLGKMRFPRYSTT